MFAPRSWAQSFQLGTAVSKTQCPPRAAAGTPTHRLTPEPQTVPLLHQNSPYLHATPSRLEMLNFRGLQLFRFPRMAQLHQRDRVNWKTCCIGAATTAPPAESTPCWNTRLTIVSFLLPSSIITYASQQREPLQQLVVDVNNGLGHHGTGQAASGCLVGLPLLQAPREVLGAVLQDKLAADEVCLLTGSTTGSILRFLQGSSCSEVLAHKRIRIHHIVHVPPHSWAATVSGGSAGVYLGD